MTDPAPPGGQARPPLPGPGGSGLRSRPHLQRGTRRPLPTWDRLKVLALLVAAFGAFVWARVAGNPILPVAEAVRLTARHQWWLGALAGLEALRQVHYLVAERSPAYHQRWTRGVLERLRAPGRTMSDWDRYRLGRAVAVVGGVAVGALALGAVEGRPPLEALAELPAQLASAAPFILLALLFVFVMVAQFVAIFWFLSRGGHEVYYPDDITTRFADVWGQDVVLEKVAESILFLEDPDSIERRGGYVPGGLLLWGPPGTGKTLMAEAVAGETAKPYVFVEPGAFTNMFVGVGVMKVKALFRKLRHLAVRYGGVIVFFDEADSLGRRGPLTDTGPLGGPRPVATEGCRGGAYLSAPGAALLARPAPGPDEGPRARSTPGERRRLRERFVSPGGGSMGTVEALLTELSGLTKPRGFLNRVVRRSLGMEPKPPPRYRILVMMATNMPQALDEALLRPGRIDRIYKVGYPSKSGRVRTYQGYLDRVDHRLTDADVDKLATITPYATGATIKDLVNEALINAIRHGREAIEWADIVRAKQLKDLGPPEDVEYVERERHSVAIHEACHAVMAYRVRRHLTIDLATIEKGGTYLGMVASIPPEDQFTRWRSEYEADILVCLASLAGERLFFEGDNSSGVGGDLESATQIATLMEGYWGMGRTVSSHGVTHKVGIGSGGRPGEPEDADLLASGLGERIEAHLGELLARAEALLSENRVSVLAVAHALETHRTVTGEDLVAIIEGRAGPLIDGSAYAHPSFALTAERYHAVAVAAHQGHGTLDVPLPVLDGDGPGVDAATEPGTAEP